MVVARVVDDEEARVSKADREEANLEGEGRKGEVLMEGRVKPEPERGLLVETEGAGMEDTDWESLCRAEVDLGMPFGCPE
jgi:hypothetical protein